MARPFNQTIVTASPAKGGATPPAPKVVGTLPSQFTPRDVYDNGGVPRIIKTLLDGNLPHEDCLALTGTPSKENLEDVKFNTNQRVVYPALIPICPLGGVVGLDGSLAPEGAIVKVAGMQTLEFKGPARRFDREEDAFAAVKAGTIEAGDMLVSRHEGPIGRPGLRAMLSTIEALHGRGMGESVALITAGHVSDAARSGCIGHVGPEAALCGPIARLTDGDLTAINANTGTLDHASPKAEFETRRKAWTAPAAPYTTGALRMYTAQVGAAVKGAITHAGGKAESVCYADV